jgi:hypothetical protein
VVDASDGAGPIRHLTPIEVARLAVSLDDRGWRDGLVSWMSPDALPADALDEDTVRALRERLGTPPGWGRAPRRARSVGARLDRVSPSSGTAPSPSQEDVERRDRTVHRLLELCRAVPDACPVEAAGVCTVAACVAWGQGDGAVARDAVERALRLHPDYRLARLLHRLLDAGLRPGAAASRAG